MIILLLLLLIPTFVVMAFSAVLIKIQVDKIKTYESWILEFKEDVNNTLENLRAIDTKGTFATSLNDKGLFESDDEVGRIFKEMELIVDKLNQRIQ